MTTGSALCTQQRSSGEHYERRKVLTAIIPGKPGLVGFIAARDDGSGGDNWSYKMCTAPAKSSPPTNQQFNTQLSADRIPFLSPNPTNSVKVLKGICTQ